MNFKSALFISWSVACFMAAIVGTIPEFGRLFFIFFGAIILFHGLWDEEDLK